MMTWDELWNKLQEEWKNKPKPSRKKKTKKWGRNDV